MPNAAEPLANRHSTGACLAVERVLVIARRVTARRCRTPDRGGVALLGLLRDLLAAAARAFSSVGKSVTLTCPFSPMRPYVMVTRVPETTAS